MKNNTTLKPPPPYPLLEPSETTGKRDVTSRDDRTSVRRTHAPSPLGTDLRLPKTSGPRK